MKRILVLVIVIFTVGLVAALAYRSFLRQQMADIDAEAKKVQEEHQVELPDPGMVAMPHYQLHPNPKIGQWARWRSQPKDPTHKTMLMTWAVVGQEEGGWWVETNDEIVGSPQASPFARTMLLSADGEFLRGIAGPKRQPLRKMTPGPEMSTPKTELLERVEETIEVPAGTFRTWKHVWRTNLGDQSVISTVWQAPDKVPFTHWVRTDTPEATTELVALGDDAKTQLEIPLENSGQRSGESSSSGK